VSSHQLNLSFPKDITFGTQKVFPIVLISTLRGKAKPTAKAEADTDKAIIIRGTMTGTKTITEVEVPREGVTGTNEVIPKETLVSVVSSHHSLDKDPALTVG
jgi:hypothetical protein